MNTYLIIDTANLYNRCLHAGGKFDTYTKTGLVIHTMMMSIKKLYEKHNADHVVFCLEHKSWRKEVFPDYKAHREVKKLLASASEKEEAQIANDIFEEFVEYIKESTCCTILQKHMVEGDDWIGAWTKLYPNDKHIIVSGDSDFYGILDDNVMIYDGVNQRYITTVGIYDDTAWYEFNIGSNSKLKVGKQVKAPYVPEFEWWKKALFMKCIRGDSGDNIPSAYPRVRVNKIDNAWNGMASNNFDYVNFMSQEVNDIHGNKTTVMEAYSFNKMLIDLNELPPVITEIIQEEINLQLAKPHPTNAGIKFIRYMTKNGLMAILKSQEGHLAYLMKQHPMKKL
jgi:5'-3' exonuclease